MSDVKTEAQDEITLSPNEAIDFLEGAYLADIRRTVCLRGSPGIGKTSVPKAVVERLRSIYPDFQYVEIHPTMPADEIGGIPNLVRVEGKVTTTDYALPAWCPTAEADPNWRGIIALDDALQGSGDVQKVLANLIQARNLRGHKLPDGAMLVATGNRMQDKAGVARTLTHFADRMCWVNIHTTGKDWIDNFALPAGLADEVIGYIMMFPDELNKFDPTKDKCPTPRTWEAVSNWVKYLHTVQGRATYVDKLANAVLGGELGTGDAIKFWQFCKVFGKLPNIDDIFADPMGHTTKYELDLQYALVIAIANKVDDNTLMAATQYIDRIGADLTAICIRLARAKNPNIIKSKAFALWSAKNQDVITGRV